MSTKMLCSKRKMSFFVEIKDKWLQEVINLPHSLVVQAVKRILGHEFIWENRKYRVNMETPTIFEATLLHMGFSKEKLVKFCRKFFKARLFTDLSRVLKKKYR